MSYTKREVQKDTLAILKSIKGYELVQIVPACFSDPEKEQMFQFVPFNKIEDNVITIYTRFCNDEVVEQIKRIHKEFYSYLYLGQKE